MTLTQIVFYLFAATAVISASLILFTKNILYAAFLLLATFLCVAAIYVFAGADFLAITQILIYVGGILVLILFGVFLTTQPEGTKFFQTGSTNVWQALLLFVSLAILFCYLMMKISYARLPWITYSQNSGTLVKDSTIQTIGMNLLTDYIIPFEVIAVLLMAALMGAAFIVGKVIKEKNK